MISDCTPTATARTDINHPSSFKTGVRVLMLMLRAKDGGSAKTDRRATKRFITRSEAEFDEALAKLRAIWTLDQRIYSTINPRNITKAIRLFKYRQLDAEYYAEADKQSFYLDLENRWVSCLNDGKSADESLFLFDFDDSMVGKSQHFPDFHIPTNYYQILDTYATRNGHHVITTPFNPAVINSTTASILMKDSLMLWSF